MSGEIHAVDSHTAGEPTRIVLAGGPSLGDGTLSERLEIFRTQHDAYRRAIITEPRGSDVLVGGLLCEPHDPSCQAGVIFFNNVGFLGMCGHGLIGLMETLRDQGKVDVGQIHIETPVGKVAATLHDDGDISVSNVESYRVAKDIEVHAEGFGTCMWRCCVWGQLVFPDQRTTAEDRTQRNQRFNRHGLRHSPSRQRRRIPRRGPC